MEIPLERFIARIENNGFVHMMTIHQQDIYFDKDDMYLYSYLASLRLRIVDEQEHTFSFKKMFYLPHKRDKYYIEEMQVAFPITDTRSMKKIFRRLQLPDQSDAFSHGEDLEEFLQEHGYRGDQRMSKVRSIYKSKGNQITLDDVDKVGVVIEVETEQEEPLEVAERLLKKGEWKRSLEGTGYVWLRNVKGLDAHIANRRHFLKVPDWNV